MKAKRHHARLRLTLETSAQQNKTVSVSIGVNRRFEFEKGRQLFRQHAQMMR